MLNCTAAMILATTICFRTFYIRIKNIFKKTVLLPQSQTELCFVCLESFCLGRERR